MAAGSADVLVRKRNGEWVVSKAGKELASYWTKIQAEAFVERLVRDAARQKRKCLCCNAPFLSWGAGNRLCDVCKRRDNFDGAV